MKKLLILTLGLFLAVACTTDKKKEDQENKMIEQSIQKIDSIESSVKKDIESLKNEVKKLEEDLKKLETI